jgi:nicotinamide phosphoribosyltransferase
MLFFGLQIYLKKYLSKPFSKQEIIEAKELVTAHGLPFNEEGFNYILEKHKGYFPVYIEALAEGSVVPVKNALVQVHNTDPNCYWVTNFIETSLLRAVWYPSTVATISWHAKEIIKEFMHKTSDSMDSLNFKLHDFGARGASSLETAG